MSKRFLSHDVFTGITTWFEGDGNGGFQLHYESDVEPLLDDNVRRYNSGNDGWVSAAKEFKHVAEIPMSLILKWKVEDGIDVFDSNDWPAVKKKLNDHEWLKLRVSPGRI